MESWNKKYESGNYPAAPHELLVKLLEKQKPGRALDLACGAGRHALFLAQNGWRVTAIDSSPAGINIARQKALDKKLSIDFAVADLEKGGFVIEKESFDLICDFCYLQIDLFPQMKAGIKPGGLIIAVVLLRGENDTEKKFSLAEGELLKFFGDMDVVHYFETPAAVIDSNMHQRRTAEIIVRKPSAK